MILCIRNEKILTAVITKAMLSIENSSKRNKKMKHIKLLNENAH